MAREGNQPYSGEREVGGKKTKKKKDGENKKQRKRYFPSFSFFFIIIFVCFLTLEEKQRGTHAIVPVEVKLRDTKRQLPRRRPRLVPHALVTNALTLLSLSWYEFDKNFR
ncbi:hypothetical protein TRSC58_07450 [Trypanosoma rangeli SC58]|uniref:Transmembrane protein n=1 Tax=Trypanosoma rangeli SC58 TaxID=429131 RepID=A0A061IT54_TRYRA|nr:hypothetical protein TRSC58_07450 [Trypanosoma rangeli SC58]